jgi:hypothetical protein
METELVKKKYNKQLAADNGFVPKLNGRGSHRIARTQSYLFQVGTQKLRRDEVYERQYEITYFYMFIYISTYL